MISGLDAIVVVSFVGLERYFQSSIVLFELLKVLLFRNACAANDVSVRQKESSSGSCCCCCCCRRFNLVVLMLMGIALFFPY